MTTEEEKQPEHETPPEPRRYRPFLLTVLCLSSFTVLGLLFLLCLAGLFYSGWITEVMNQYLPQKSYGRGETLLFFLAGAVLHGTALTGSILMWKMRKTGYYLLGSSCLLITIFQLFNPDAAVSPVALYIALVILFGLFYHRFE